MFIADFVSEAVTSVDLCPSGLSAEMCALGWSLVPFVDLKGGFPIGMGLGLHPVVAAGIAFLGASIWTMLLLLLAKVLIGSNSLASVRQVPFIAGYLDRLSRRYEHRFQAVGDALLVVIVAIPLPFTGVLTGSLLACIFEISFRKSIFLLTIGNLIALSIVVFVSISGFKFYDFIS